MIPICSILHCIYLPLPHQSSHSVPHRNPRGQAPTKNDIVAKAILGAIENAYIAQDEQLASRVTIVYIYIRLVPTNHYITSDSLFQEPVFPTERSGWEAHCDCYIVKHITHTFINVLKQHYYNYVLGFCFVPMVSKHKRLPMLNMMIRKKALYPAEKTTQRDGNKK
jgi:hypothetical protein